MGILFNGLRDNSISWIASPMEIVESSDEILDINIEPTIRQIDLPIAKNLHESSVLFVDARSSEYLDDGIISGAIFNENIDSLAVMISSLIGYDTAFVIYCSDDDCGSSEELAYELQEFGFNNILVFKGGWRSWSEEGLEVEYND